MLAEGKKQHGAGDDIQSLAITAPAGDCVLLSQLKTHGLHCDTEGVDTSDGDQLTT